MPSLGLGLGLTHARRRAAGAPVEPAPAPLALRLDGDAGARSFVATAAATMLSRPVSAPTAVGTFGWWRAAWFRSDGLSGSQDVISNYRTDNNQRGVTLQLASSNVQVVYSTGGTSFATLALGTAASNRTDFALFWYDPAAQRVRGRLNGGSVVETASAVSAIHASTAPLAVGGLWVGVASPSNGFVGRIDEVSGGRSEDIAADIAAIHDALWAGGAGGDLAALAAAAPAWLGFAYPLDEAGGRAYDLVGGLHLDPFAGAGAGPGAALAYDSEGPGRRAGRLDAEAHDFTSGVDVLPPGVRLHAGLPELASSGRRRIALNVLDPGTGTGSSKRVAIKVAPAGTGSPADGDCFAVLRLRESDGTAATIASASYRDGDSDEVFGPPHPLQRGTLSAGAWHEFGIVLNGDGTYDLEYQGLPWHVGIACPNGGAGEPGRLVVEAESSAEALQISGVTQQAPYAPRDDCRVDHNLTAQSGAIETLTPQTDTRNAHPQPPRIPADADSYGGLTAGPSGAQGEAGKVSAAIYRGRPDGWFACQFVTSPGLDEWVDLLLRCWGGPDGGTAGGDTIAVRVDEAEGELRLNLGTGTENVSTLADAAVDLDAGTRYTIWAHASGRVYRVWLAPGAMGSPPATAPAILHLPTDADTGGRGLLSEEDFGVCVPGDGPRVERLRFSGRKGPEERVAAIGGATWGLGAFGVRELYLSGHTTPTRNLVANKLGQSAHRASADAGNRRTYQRVLADDADHLYCVRQRGICVNEYEHHGDAGADGCYYTVTRRGLWISDSTRCRTTTRNVAPDNDLRDGAWGTTLARVGPTGTGGTTTLSFADWTLIYDNAGLPIGHQLPTLDGTARLSHVLGAVAGYSASSGNQSSYKRLGNGAPISVAIGVGTPSAGTTYTCWRHFLLEVGSGLDQSTADLAEIRDAVMTPPTPTFGVGSLRTAEAGDHDADGFNHRFGWYEVDAADGAVSLTLPVASGVVHRPQFRLWGLSGESVTIDGSPAVEGVDYVLGDAPDGAKLLQILSDRTDDTAIAVGA